MHVKRKTYLSVAAVFALMFLLLLNLIPGAKASAATKTYSIACTGGTISYYNSNATSFSSNANVTYSCSNKGSFTITVRPNTSTSPRTITLYSKKGGTILDTLVIKQAGIPCTTLSAGSTGGKLYYYNANAYSYTYSNTAVCSGRNGNYFVVKPNSNTASRSCKVTVKNRAGTPLAYITINQSGVPVKNVSVSGDSSSFAYGKSGATSFVPSNRNMITNISASNPGSFKFYVSANPSTSATRSTDIIVKNSAGTYLEIIRVTQAKHTVKTYNNNYNSDPRNVNYTCANADPSKTTVSNTSMCSYTSLGSGKFQVKLKQNTSTSSRSCTITFKDKYGTALAKYVINQSGVPVKSVSVSGGSTSFAYGKSGATSFAPSNKNMITNISASNPGSFKFYVSANPSTITTRSTDIIVKNSAGTYLEIIRVTQAKYTPPTIKYSVDSKRNTITYTNSAASRFAYSVPSMCNSSKSLESGKYQFIINANNHAASRNGIITVYDKYNTVIAKLSITQSAVVTYTVGSGAGENISYNNANAVKFNLPINIKSVRCTSAGNFIFTQTVNRGTLKIDRNIEVLDKSGNIIQYLRVVSLPNIMRIKGNFAENIPNAGKSYNVSFETSNPVTVTLTNAKFSDGTTTKSINKNAVKANTYNTTNYTIKVDALNGSASRQVKISVSNGLHTETKTMTQLGQQIGFRGATAEYPLGSLGRDHYVYRIAASVGSNWTKLDSVNLKDYGFDVVAALSTSLSDSAGILDFAVINGQNIIFNGADNCFVNATFYKDASDNRYVIITGNDSSTQKKFMNFPAQSVYNSDTPINANINKVKYSGYIDGAHATNDNWVFWVDANGNMKMNLRKFGKDSFKVNDIEIGYRMGYSSPSTGGTSFRMSYPIASNPYDVCSRYKDMLNKLIK